MEMNSSEVTLNNYATTLVATIFLIFISHWSIGSFIKLLQKDIKVGLCDFCRSFGVALMGTCLYWIFGDGKRQEKVIRKMLVYMWALMLFGLVVNFVKFIFQ